MSASAWIAGRKCARCATGMLRLRRDGALIRRLEDGALSAVAGAHMVRTEVPLRGHEDGRIEPESRLTRHSTIEIVIAAARLRGR